MFFFFESLNVYIFFKDVIKENEGRISKIWVDKARGDFKRGITYRFKVAATLDKNITTYGEAMAADYGNKNNESKISNPVAYDAARTLGQPTNVTVEELTDSERVIVKWKAPIDKTEAITHYMITVMNPENDAVLLNVLTTKSTDLSAPISRMMLANRGLDPNGTYKIIVQSGNKDADYGQKSSPVIKSLAPASGPAGTPTGAPPTSVKLLSLQNPLGSATFEELIAKLIDWLLVVTLPIIVLLILYAGFLFMISGVSPDQRKNAVNIVKYALIGYAIMLLAKVLVGVVMGFFS